MFTMGIKHSSSIFLYIYVVKENTVFNQYGLLTEPISDTVVIFLNCTNMKNLFVCLLAFASFSAMAEEIRKGYPDFWVRASEKDARLSKSEAVFEFRFMNPEIKSQPGTF